MKILKRRVKITKLKLLIAEFLFFITKMFLRENKRVISRNNLKFEIDLNEGIDLHLFLFGNFQKHVTENKYLIIPKDAVIFDIGANCGIMALFYARKIENGKIHAFEPTNYAIKKFRRNLELNPAHKNKIIINQFFISSCSKTKHNIKAYSSWPIRSNKHKHNIHRGVFKSAINVSAISLNDYCKLNQINQIDLIKIDTDGYEYEVLKGGFDTIKKTKPQIIFELGIYVMKEHGIDFKDYIKLFENLNYEMITTNGEIINYQNYKKYVPEYGTIDIISIPR